MIKKRTNGYIFKPFLLGAAEYAKIYGEICSNYDKYRGKALAIHASYGIDDIAYLYYFENKGFGEYNIYMRVEM